MEIDFCQVHNKRKVMVYNTAELVKSYNRKPTTNALECTLCTCLQVFTIVTLQQQLSSSFD